MGQLYIVITRAVRRFFIAPFQDKQGRSLEKCIDLIRNGISTLHWLRKTLEQVSGKKAPRFLDCPQIVERKSLKLYQLQYNTQYNTTIRS